MRLVAGLLLVAPTFGGCVDKGGGDSEDTDLDPPDGDTDTDADPLGMPTFWQMDDSCLAKDADDECVSGGAGDFLYLGTSEIRHVFWYGFEGYGTGGVGSSLSVDGGATFSHEPGYRISSSGVPGQWDFNIAQGTVFESGGAWRFLVDAYSTAENADGPTSLYLFDTNDGLSFMPVGPAVGVGSPTEAALSYVGRGATYRDANGTLRGLFGCNLSNGQVYGEPASDVCSMVSADEGETWSIDTAVTSSWLPVGQGETWEEEPDFAGDGIAFVDGNEAYVFLLPDGSYGVVFTLLLYGMFGATSADGIDWSAPTELAIRNADGTTPCEASDPNGDGFYTHMEDDRNCEVGDLAVLRRADGSLALVSNYPSAGMMAYTGVW